MRRSGAIDNSASVAAWFMTPWLRSAERILYTERMNRTNTLDRLVDPVVRTFTPEVARALIRLRADPELRSRMGLLAEKCNEGKLTADEREEYETSIRFANYLAILQAKARRLLKVGERA